MTSITADRLFLALKARMTSLIINANLELHLFQYKICKLETIGLKNERKCRLEDYANSNNLQLRHDAMHRAYVAIPTKHRH